jgi:PAS domain-containing protein
MTDGLIAHWTRQLGFLRAQANKQARIGPCGDILTESLAACEALVRDLAGAHLECDRLRADLRASTAAWDHLFDVIPAACLLTDVTAVILNANRIAAVFLNVNAKHLKDRELIVFFEDRAAFADLVHRVARSGGDQLHATLTVRPRERKPTAVEVVVVPLEGGSGLWVWFLRPGLKSPASPPISD